LGRAATGRVRYKTVRPALGRDHSRRTGLAWDQNRVPMSPLTTPRPSSVASCPQENAPMREDRFKEW